MRRPDSLTLGIDAGSVSVSVVEIDSEGTLLRHSYRFHDGRPRETLTSILNEFASENGNRWARIAVTRSAASLVREPSLILDDNVAAISAARRRYGRIGSLLIVGGERFGLFSFSGDGSYESFKGNSSCAAGTGGFLDQQAERLGLADAAELAELAETANHANTEAPRIATRCAVFAKTDLIHAQQEGYSLPSIADGLCKGLVGNLLDVLLEGKTPSAPLVMAGGVAMNPAVVRHVGALSGIPPQVDDDAPLYAAMGAAWTLLDSSTDTETDTESKSPFRLNADDVVAPAVQSRVDRGFRYPALELRLSDYPDFQCFDSWEIPVEGRKGRYPVEVEVFEQLPESGTALLGIDVGSTSTKAVLLTENGSIPLGLYTRTAGRPVDALKGLLMALEQVLEKYDSRIEITGCATTGSGRKLTGEILAADLILDEITAHARAAVSIDPDVDTIIEIGGQDSKFTTLSGGRVTSSVMNKVCAAGTGSFLEEQAARLGCVVTDYAGRTEGVSAPVTSDRCTVFMQRDLNHLLSEGLSVDEVLAAALHGVRENYLNKVAVRSRIGKTVFFQGATARIRTLIAAFEQTLNRPIIVSRYCRHTGALGAALQLADEGRVSGGFRGTGLWREEIPVRTETCSLCRNACKITLAEVRGETVAYGFLCGRDYQTQHFVPTLSDGFNAEKERRKAFAAAAPRTVPAPSAPYTLGIPSSIYLNEEIPFWEYFFALLNIPVVVDRDGDPLEDGKKLTRAEFCAPITALHGRVASLLEKSDYIFLPVYLEDKGTRKTDRRWYCYYSQFAPSMIGQIVPEGRLVSPLVKSLYGEFRGIAAVHEALSALPGEAPDFRTVSSAWQQARDRFENARKELKKLHVENAREDDVNAILIGRPYVVNDSTMNKGIPHLFDEAGVRVFGMDMIDTEAGAEISELVEHLPWDYASRIMEAAQAVVNMPNSYPVLITSFMCSPDSFIVPYARKLWEARGKPYLILELDGHGSNVGYSTRVEAALRSFRNHFRDSQPAGKGSLASLMPDCATGVRGKTLLLPNWDNDVMPLLAASLRREGIDARLLEETPDHIQRGSRSNNGECLPLNVIARETADYIRKHHLNPRKTVLWMIRGMIACNIPLYPQHIRFQLQEEGGGLEHVRVLVDAVGFTGVSPLSVVNTYYSYMFGGLLKRIGCRIRPYEVNSGETDRVLAMARDRLVKAFLGRFDKLDVVQDIVQRLEAIPVNRCERPKVAIFGDIYVRDNAVMNQNLIHYIEANGGEVVTTPYNQYAKMMADSYFKRLFREHRFREMAMWKVTLAALKLLEGSYNKLFSPLAGTDEPYKDESEPILAEYGVRIEHSGESFDNLLKIHYLAARHDDLALLVQTSPSFCCAGLITEAMRKKIQDVTGIPVVSISYDGTGGDKNSVVIPYLAYPVKKRSERQERKEALRA